VSQITGQQAYSFTHNTDPHLEEKHLQGPFRPRTHSYSCPKSQVSKPILSLTQHRPTPRREAPPRPFPSQDALLLVSQITDQQPHSLSHTYPTDPHPKEKHPREGPVRLSPTAPLSPMSASTRSLTRTPQTHTPRRSTP